MPCRLMPSTTTQHGWAKYTPVDHHRDQVQAGKVSAEQLGEGGLGLGHEFARLRRSAGGCRGLTDLLPDRLEADLVAADTPAGGAHPG